MERSTSLNTYARSQREGKSVVQYTIESASGPETGHRAHHERRGTYTHFQ